MQKHFVWLKLPVLVTSDDDDPVKSSRFWSTQKQPEMFEGLPKKDN